MREGGVSSATGKSTFLLSIADGIEDESEECDAISTDSRLAIDGLKASFEEGDKIGLTCGDLVNLEFDVTLNSVGSMVAVAADDELGEQMVIGDSVYSYYPYQADAGKVIQFEFPAEQIQSDEEASHLADYDVLIASPRVLRSSNTLTFSHAVAWLEFDVYNDYSSTDDYLKSVTITAPEAIFVTEAELNTCAGSKASDYMSFTPLATTNEIKISVEEGVEDWNLMEAKLKATLRMAIVPVDLSDMTITVTAETKNRSGNNKITYSGAGMKFAAGKKYKLIIGEPYYVRTPVGDLEFYIPNELKRNNFNSDDATWSYNRCVESEHFILFWAKDFGDDPSNPPSSSMSVNVENVLSYAEAIYDMNVNTLGFREIDGPSYLDQYKMEIYIYYLKNQSSLATGSGYDNTIGALWANVDGCDRETMAHEIGHSFQYQTNCDSRLTGSSNSSTCGWQYGFGKNPGSGSDDGNGWWEQCAQWQCYQVYPSAMFTNGWYSPFPANVHLHPLHEEPRYSNYFIQDYWIMVQGDDFIGRLWRLAEKPEDPIDVYMRLTSTSLSDFNEAMFDYACRLQTYDITHCSEHNGAKYVDAFSKYAGILDDGDGYYRITYGSAPENYGFNAIRIKAPGEATTMKADLVGIAGETGYRNPSDTSGTLWSLDKAGWKFGFVGYNSSSKTHYYGEHYSMTGASATGTATFDCPADCDYVWLVVMGAPQEYWHHAWNGTSTDDEQWPYKFKLTNAELYYTPQKEIWDSSTNTYTFGIGFERSTSAYEAANLSPDLSCLAEGLGLSSSTQFSNNLSRMTVVGLNADGTTTSGTTANLTYGYWFDSNGTVCSWGSSAYVYLQTDDFKTIEFGQYPNRCVSGTTYLSGYQITYQNKSVKIIVEATAN